MKLELSLASATERQRAARMLQSLLIGDLLGPYGPLIVALNHWEEWTVVDNTQGGFSTLCPEWPRGHVALSGVLVQFLQRGRHVQLVTPPGYDTPFANRVLCTVERLGLGGLQIREGKVEDGAICTSAFVVEGAIEALLAGTAEKSVRFDTDAEVALARFIELGGTT